jgi:hypothetical protein
MSTPLGIAALLLCCALVACAGDLRILRNPTPRAYPDAAVRLRQPAIGPAGTFVVTADGIEVPYQVERIGETDYVWVCRSFEPGTSATCSMAPGTPKAMAPPRSL